MPKSYRLRKKQTVQIFGTASLTLSHNSRLYIGEGSTNVVGEHPKRGFDQVLPNQFFDSLQRAFGVAADPAVTPGP